MLGCRVTLAPGLTPREPQAGGNGAKCRGTSPASRVRARSERDRHWRVQGDDKDSAQKSQANCPGEGALALGVEDQWEECVLVSGQSIA